MDRGSILRAGHRLGASWPWRPLNADPSLRPALCTTAGSPAPNPRQSPPRPCLARDRLIGQVGCWVRFQRRSRLPDPDLLARFIGEELTFRLIQEVLLASHRASEPAPTPGPLYCLRRHALDRTTVWVELTL